jgi:hypothetical protein
MKSKTLKASFPGAILTRISYVGGVVVFTDLRSEGIAEKLVQHPTN